MFFNLLEKGCVMPIKAVSQKSIKAIFYVFCTVQLCILFAGCSTSHPPAELSQATNTTESNTDLGMRFLAGEGVPQDDERAFYYLSKAAREDDPFAENELGYLYAAGRGVSRDYEKAFYYYQQAAEHGLASAQYNLGLMYARGLGTAPNKALALEWFQKSAEHGFEPAKVALTQYRS